MSPNHTKNKTHVKIRISKTMSIHFVTFGTKHLNKLYLISPKNQPHAKFEFSVSNQSFKGNAVLFWYPLIYFATLKYEFPKNYALYHPWADNMQ